MRVVPDAISLLHYEYGDRVAIFGKVMWPWMICYHTVGVEDFLIMTQLDPDQVRVLLQRTPKDVYPQARYNIGAGGGSISPECTISLQTPITNLKAIVTAAEEGYVNLRVNRDEGGK